MEPTEFQKVLQLGIHQTMEDPNLKGHLAVLPPLSSHGHNSPKELEALFLEKICVFITKKMTQYFSGSRKMFLLPIHEKELKGSLKSVVYWRKSPPIAVGALYLQVLLVDSQLKVEFSMDITSCEVVTFTLPLEPQIQKLRAGKNSQLLPRLNPDTCRLLFIDLEWVSCYKGPNEKNVVDPDQISEFSFYTQDYFYNSGYLKVSKSYLKRMHKKLLDKMGISPELMQARHREGDNFLTQWEQAVLPLLEEEKPTVFLSYGTEDGKILKKLIPSGKKVQFIDVSGHFSIFNFGQMALLNGLGVEFTHDFSSDMDVKALFLIYQVFSQCKTVEDSRNLQLALQLHKMLLYSTQEEDKEKLKIYLSFLLKQGKNQILFQNALDMAKESVDNGNFHHKTL